MTDTSWGWRGASSCCEGAQHRLSSVLTSPEGPGTAELFQEKVRARLVSPSGCFPRAPMSLHNLRVLQCRRCGWFRPSSDRPETQTRVQCAARRAARESCEFAGTQRGDHSHACRSNRKASAPGGLRPEGAGPASGPPFGSISPLCMGPGPCTPAAPTPLGVRHWVPASC